MWTWLLFVAACSGPDRRPGDDAPPDAPPDARAAFREEMDLKSKAPHRMPPPEKRAIDWDAADGRRAVDTSVMSEEARQAIGQSPVPVLLPRQPQLLETAVVLVGDGWYTATMSDDRHRVFVRGTRVARPMDWSDRERRALKERKDDVRITRTDGILSAHFSLAGCAYNIEVECKQADDTLCTDDARVVELQKAFGLAGGRRGQ